MSCTLVGGLINVSRNIKGACSISMPEAVAQSWNDFQVIIFAVPGAFTPTCSTKHLPGFVEKADEFKGKGVDTIACIAVNDAFVMEAWAKTVGIDGKIMMLADGSANFAKVWPSYFSCLRVSRSGCE